MLCDYHVSTASNEQSEFSQMASHNKDIVVLDDEPRLIYIAPWLISNSEISVWCSYNAMYTSLILPGLICKDGVSFFEFIIPNIS